MGDSTVNVLQVLIGGKTFTGVASYLYQQYTHIDRSRVHYDFLFCRENAMELVMHDEVFSDSQFISLNAIRKNSSVDYHMFIKGLRSAIAAKQYDYIVQHLIASSIIMDVVFTLVYAGILIMGLFFFSKYVIRKNKHLSLLLLGSRR